MKINLTDNQSVTATIYPAAARKRLRVTLLLGHGAGADQKSAFMVSFATELAARGVDTVTFNFLYTEQGRNAPDTKSRLEACYHAAIAAVRKHKRLGGNRLAIGGKSMGGRIASQVAAEEASGLCGLVFLGYPLHPPGKPEQLRIEHLPRIAAPMLFLQGTRDPFGTPAEFKPILKKLKGRATLYAIEDGDHSFTVLKRSQKSQAQVYSDAQEEIVRWLSQTACG